jgi:hypothetical protein
MVSAARRVQICTASHMHTHAHAHTQRLMLRINPQVTETTDGRISRHYTCFRLDIIHLLAILHILRAVIDMIRSRWMRAFLCLGRGVDTYRVIPSISSSCSAAYRRASVSFSYSHHTRHSINSKRKASLQLDSNCECICVCARACVISISLRARVDDTTRLESVRLSQGLCGQDRAAHLLRLVALLCLRSPGAQRTCPVARAQAVCPASRRR